MDMMLLKMELSKMKNITLLLLLSLLLQSCSLFKSKDELLTQEKWILNNRYISNYVDGKSKNKMIFYKKADETLTLKFDMDGTVRIREDKGAKFATIKWYWKNDDKKYIVLDRGKYTGDFYVLDLTNSELKWSKSDIHSTKSTLETFKHLDDKEWDDEKVEMMNKMN